MQQSPRSVAFRAAGVVLIAGGLVVAGILVDALTGFGPFGTLSALVVGVIFGTVMIVVIVMSSFPAATNKQDDPADMYKPEQ